jgi:hypothetical protein
MDALKKLMEKKMSKEGEMDPMKKKAKLELIQELHDMAGGMMKDDLTGHLDGLKKVTVASDTKEGLEKGLDKAKELTDKGPGASLLEEDSEEDELLESPEKKASELETGVEDLHSMSREELLAKLMLMKQK